MEQQEQYLPAARDANQSLSLQRVADGLFKSGLFPNAKNNFGAFAITQYGAELGIGPMMSLKNINIISGQLAANGQLMLSLAMKVGVTFNVITETDKEVTIEFKRPLFNAYKATFTWADAEKAGLIGKDNWKKYPKDMLYWRCVAKGVRRIAPEAVMGLYTPDEISSGDVIDVTEMQPEKQPVQEPSNQEQDPKIKKAIAWTIKQGMTKEEMETAVGPLDLLTTHDLESLKAAYMVWKGKTPPAAPQEAPNPDELPGTHLVQCTAGNEPVMLHFCRTGCGLIASYRECPDYLQAK